MERDDAERLRALLEPTGWVERTTEFARALRTSTRSPGGLLLVGPEEEEPWHLTAHLDDESRYSGIPQLSPTLVRWNPPPDAPNHLSIGLDRLADTRKGESLLVVSGIEEAPPGLLERVNDVRRRGTSVFALDTGDAELESLATETLRVEEHLLSFEGAQHLVSLAAGDLDQAGTSGRKKGFRARLGDILDRISGPPE